MKKEKIYLFSALMSFICMAASAFLYIYLPEPDKSALVRGAERRMQEAKQEPAGRENTQIEAENEIVRFREMYNIEIEPEEMEKQIAIREEYEAIYKKSYPLEEVFLPPPEEEKAHGDPGEDDAYWEMIGQIEAYRDAYKFEESMYEGMTAEEELKALKEKYGSLKENEGGKNADKNQIEE